MALFHSTSGRITRSNGRSISANIAYITGSKIYDERTGILHNYAGKQVGEFDINIPSNAPVWMGKKNNLEKLLNHYEQCEDKFHKARFKANHKDLIKREKSLAARKNAIANAQMGYTLEFSLQRELSKKQNKEFAAKYIKENFTNRGFISVHAYHFEEGNPHCHVLVLPRKWVGKGFDKVKETSRKVDGRTNNLFNKDGIKNILRPSLEDYINTAFKQAGLTNQVSCKSYKDLNVNQIPGKHVGVYASKYLPKGEESIIGSDNKDIERRNFIRMLDDPSILLRKMSHSYVAFSRGDIEREILKIVHNDQNKYVALCQKVDFYLQGKMPELFNREVANVNVQFDSKEMLQELESKVSSFADYILNSDGAVSLGEGIGGIERFTSKESKESESIVLSLIDGVVASKDLGKLAESDVAAGMDKGLSLGDFDSYSDEQYGAIEFLCGSGQLLVLEGRAGTGKSTVLNPVKEAYESAGYRVIGAAFQGKMAQSLGRDLGISSYTLASLQLRWREYDKYKAVLESGGVGQKELNYARRQVSRHSEYQLDNRSVLLVDEGSMISGSDWSNILREVSSKGAILRIVQDNAQIKSIIGSNISRAIGEKAQSFALSTIYRQKHDWQRSASVLINEHRFEEGLAVYEHAGSINYTDNLSTAMCGAVERFLKCYSSETRNLSNKLPNVSIITKKNSTVNALNRQVFDRLCANGSLGKKFDLIVGEEGKNPIKQEFAVGAEIIFKQNDFREYFVKTINSNASSTSKPSGIANGTLGRIVGFDEESGALQVKLHGEGDQSRTVEFDSKKYSSIGLGYAFTTNSEQGVTRDKTIVIPDRSLSAGDLTVMLTRHRESMDIILNKDIYKNFREIASGIRFDDHLIADYSVTEEQKPYLDLVNSFKECSRKLYNHYSEIDAKKGDIDKSELYKSAEVYSIQRESYARQIVDNWDRCSTLAGQAKLRLEDLEVIAGVRERNLSRFERLCVDKVEEYYAAALDSRNLYQQITSTHKGVLAQHHEDYSQYLGLRNVRDELACEISKNPSLYKPFFRIKTNRDESGKVFGFSSNRYTYESMPPRFKRVLAQAEAYRERIGKDHIIDVLSGERKYLYEQLQIYVDSKRTAASSYYHLNESGTSLLPKVYTQIEDIGKDAGNRRDIAAHNLIERVSDPKYSESDNRFFEGLCKRFNVDTNKLLHHSTQGSIRLFYDKYIDAKDLAEKLSGAKDLYYHASDINGHLDGKISKQSYAILRDIGCDVNRLRFERNVAIHSEQTGEQLFKSKDSLESTYVNINEVNNAMTATNKSWLIVRQENRHATEKLQESFLGDLQTEGISKELQFKHIREEALEHNLGGVACNGDYKREDLMVKAVGEVNSRLGGLYAQLQSPDKNISATYERLQSLGENLSQGHRGYITNKSLYGGEGSSNLDIWKNHKNEQIRLSQSLHELIMREHNSKGSLNKILKFGRVNTVQFYRNVGISDNKESEMKNQNQTKLSSVKLDNEQSTQRLEESNYSRPQYNRYDISTLCNDVCRQTDIRWLAESILQDKVNSKLSNSRQIRFGRRGSLSFDVNSGTYKDFESDSGGNVIGFVKDHLGTDFKGSLSYIRDYSNVAIQGRIDEFLGNNLKVNTDLSAANAKLEQQRKKLITKRAAEEEQQNKYKLECVRDLADKREPVIGTQAEKYLASRGISTDGLSNDIGYLAAGTKFNYIADEGKVERTIYTGALISIGRDNNNEITGVQLTYLKDGAKQKDRDGNVLTKRQYGSFKNSLVSVHNPENCNTVIISEGLETACSIKESLGLDKSNDINIAIYASNGISNIKNISQKNYKNVILAGDYDGVGAATHEQLESVGKDLQESGINVSVLYPEHGKDSSEKLDYNDLLQKDNGKEIIRSQFIAEISELDKELSVKIDQKNNSNTSYEKDKIASKTNETLINVDNNEDYYSKDGTVSTSSAIAQVPGVNDDLAKESEKQIDSRENDSITDPKVISALRDLEKVRFHLLALSNNEFAFEERKKYADLMREKLIELPEYYSQEIEKYVKGYEYNKQAYNLIYGNDHLSKDISLVDKAREYVQLAFTNDEKQGFRVSDRLKEYEYSRANETPENIIIAKEQNIKNYIYKELGKEFIINPNDNTLSSSDIDNSNNENVLNDEYNVIKSLEKLHEEIASNDRLGIKDEKLEEKYQQLCLEVGRDDKLLTDLRNINNSLADVVAEKVKEDDRQQESNQQNGMELEI